MMYNTFAWLSRKLSRNKEISPALDTEPLGVREEERRPVSFLPGCPECQPNILKQQMQKALLQPITRFWHLCYTHTRKHLLRRMKELDCYACCQSVCCQTVKFNEYTEFEWPIKSSSEEAWQHCPGYQIFQGGIMDFQQTRVICSCAVFANQSRPYSWTTAA